MISTKGRYALRVMIDLTQHKDDGFVPLKSIAQRQKVSQKYLEMIVACLNKGGIVISQRGKEGGYQLSRSADKITVGEIITLMEGSMAPVACLDCEKNDCDRAENCLTLPMWQNLDNMISEYLGQITIQDLVDGKIPNMIESHDNDEDHLDETVIAE